MTEDQLEQEAWLTDFGDTRLFGQNFT